MTKRTATQLTQDMIAILYDEYDIEISQTVYEKVIDQLMKLSEDDDIKIFNTLDIIRLLEHELKTKLFVE